MTTMRVQPDLPSVPDTEKLDELLGRLESQHGTLLELAGRQRDAVRTADAGALGAVIQQTAETIGRIQETERERRDLVKQPDGSLPTVEQLARDMDETHAAKLLDRAQSLRELMRKVHQEHEAVRKATEAIAGHMRGMVEQVSAKLSYTGTYSQRGSVRPGSQQVVSGIDTVR